MVESRDHAEYTGRACSGAVSSGGPALLAPADTVAGWPADPSAVKQLDAYVPSLVS
jgi:hypothetical protein